MPYDVILYLYAFTIEGTRGLARVINKVLDCLPLQYLCILATRPRCDGVCTGNMYKEFEYLGCFFFTAHDYKYIYI